METLFFGDFYHNVDEVRKYTLYTTFVYDEEKNRKDK